MSRQDRAFFPAAAEVHPRWNTLVTAIAGQGACAAIMTLTPFPQLVVYIGTSLTPFTVLSVISLLVFRQTHSEWKRLGVVDTTINQGNRGRPQSARLKIGTERRGERLHLNEEQQEHLDSPLSRHHDVSMRTTLTLDDDLARRLKEQAHRRRKSFKQVVNEALRAGLEGSPEPVGKRKVFKVKPSHCGFRAGIDIGKLNQLSDELEAEDFVADARR